MTWAFWPFGPVWPVPGLLHDLGLLALRAILVGRAFFVGRAYFVGRALSADEHFFVRRAKFRFRFSSVIRPSEPIFFQLVRFSVGKIFKIGRMRNPVWKCRRWRIFRDSQVPLWQCFYFLVLVPQPTWLQSSEVRSEDSEWRRLAFRENRRKLEHQILQKKLNHLFQFCRVLSVTFAHLIIYYYYNL